MSEDAWTVLFVIVILWIFAREPCKVDDQFMERTERHIKELQTSVRKLESFK